MRWAHRNPSPDQSVSHTVPLPSAQDELALLIDALQALATSSSCLDARAAAHRRIASLQAARQPHLAPAVEDARRLGARLQEEREEVLSGRFGCRHVVTAP
jgi:hypothetical protein